MRTRCAERAAAAGACQSGWAGSGTGSSRTPPGRTGISPVGSRCEQRPTGRKRLRNTPRTQWWDSQSWGTKQSGKVSTWDIICCWVHDSNQSSSHVTKFAKGAIIFYLSVIIIFAHGIADKFTSTSTRVRSFGACASCQFTSCKTTLVIIHHHPLRDIDKVEWTNTLPKHATSPWASGTVIQNKQGACCWSRGGGGVHNSMEDISACSYNNQQEYRAKCHENGAVCGLRMDGGGGGGVKA